MLLSRNPTRTHITAQQRAPYNVWPMWRQRTSDGSFSSGECARAHMKRKYTCFIKSYFVCTLMCFGLSQCLAHHTKDIWGLIFPWKTLNWMSWIEFMLIMLLFLASFRLPNGRLCVCVCVLQHSALPCRHPICQFTEFQYTYLFGYLAMCVYQRSGILLAVEFSTANEELYHWIFRFILLIANNYNIFFCCCLSFLYFRLHVLIISSNFSIRHLTIFERNACHNAIVEQIMRKLLATSISGLLECTDFCVKRCESAIFYWYTTISCGKVRAVILERRTALVFSIKFAADKKISKECKTHSCCTKYVDNKT